MHKTEPENSNFNVINDNSFNYKADEKKADYILKENIGDEKRL
jgi:hypothetical protein